MKQKHWIITLSVLCVLLVGALLFSFMQTHKYQSLFKEQAYVTELVAEAGAAAMQGDIYEAQRLINRATDLQEEIGVELP